MNLSKNTVLITGGSAGIGLALAKEFLSRDNIVIICGRDPKKLELARLQHPDLNTIVCDVSDEQSITTMVDTLRNKYPKLNLLINNAGVMHLHDIVKDSLTLECQQKEVMTNFFGVIALCNKLLPHLQKQNNSAVLNVTSGLAYMPFLAAPVYAATKAGIHSYTQSIRQAFKNTSVMIFEALPPMVDTEMSQGIEMEGMTKMSPETLAEIIINQMEKGKEEIRPGQAASMIKMYKIFPWMINKMMEKMAPKILVDIPKY